MAIPPKYWSGLHGLATLILISAALYFLLVEHGAHILPYLPYLIILLCPLMHLFMHRSHGGHTRAEDKHHDENQAYQRGEEKRQK